MGGVVASGSGTLIGSTALFEIVPEPSSLLLGLSALATLALLTRLQRRQGSRTPVRG